MNKRSRRLSSILSLRKWMAFLTRGDNWFVAFGRLYVFDSQGTERLRDEMMKHPFPGKKGRLFRTANNRKLFTAKGVDGVLISGLGRFGNGVQQFVHATSFALETGAAEILFFPNQSTRRRSTAARNNVILRAIHSPLLPTQRHPQVIWRSDFFESGETLHTFDKRASQTVRPALQSIYSGPLQGTTPEAGTLTIHLRSGDVFRDDPHPGYGQPPLAFYQQVIDSEDWTRVEIVSEDSLNPCQEPLLDHLLNRGIPVTAAGAEMSEAIRVLSQARNVVASRGTFVPAVLFLSDAPKRVYAFGHNIDRIPAGPPHSYWLIADTKGRYVEEVLSLNWQNSPAQRRLMADYPKSNLSAPFRATH